MCAGGVSSPGRLRRAEGEYPRCGGGVEGGAVERTLFSARDRIAREEVCDQSNTLIFTSAALLNTDELILRSSAISPFPFFSPPLLPAHKRQQKNWEEADYYDSDEDSFLDRTGSSESSLT